MEWNRTLFFERLQQLLLFLVEPLQLHLPFLAKSLLLDLYLRGASGRGLRLQALLKMQILPQLLLLELQLLLPLLQLKAFELLLLAEVEFGHLRSTHVLAETKTQLILLLLPLQQQTFDSRCRRTRV